MDCLPRVELVHGPSFNNGRIYNIKILLLNWPLAVGLAQATFLGVHLHQSCRCPALTSTAVVTWVTACEEDYFATDN
jgi:hypothetical protein